MNATVHGNTVEDLTQDDQAPTAPPSPSYSPPPSPVPSPPESLLGMPRHGEVVIIQRGYSINDVANIESDYKTRGSTTRRPTLIMMPIGQVVESFNPTGKIQCVWIDGQMVHVRAATKADKAHARRGIRAWLLKRLEEKTEKRARKEAGARPANNVMTRP